MTRMDVEGWSTLGISAQGVEYKTMPHVLARLAELQYENLGPAGESDGRVTETNLIFEALEVMARDFGAEHVGRAVQYLFTMTTWLMLNDAPINPIGTEMGVAVGNSNLGIVFGRGRKWEPWPKVRS
jgi:hypothetical protein